MGYNVNIKGKAEYTTWMKMKLPVFGYFCTEHRAQLHQIEDFLDNEWGVFETAVRFKQDSSKSAANCTIVDHLWNYRDPGSVNYFRG